MSGWSKLKILGTLIPAIGAIVGIVLEDKADKKKEEKKKAEK